MARRAVIDRQDLFKAANAIADEGKDVTALALLDKLGGGSLTTIYKYLSEWLVERPATAPADEEKKVPDQVQNAFMNTWRIATLEAARETTAVKEKAAEEVRAAQKQFEGALEAIQKLELEAEQDAAQIEQLKAKVSELEAALVSAGNDNAALKATAQQLNHQVKSQEAELDRLHNRIENDRLRHQNELAQAHSELAAAQEKANAEHQRLSEHLSTEQKRADQAERDRSETQLKLEQAGKQLTELGERLQAAEHARQAADKEREAAIKQASELKGQAQTLQAQNTELIAKLAELAAAKPTPDAG